VGGFHVVLQLEPISPGVDVLVWENAIACGIDISLDLGLL
jgi:hypothetical protein